MKKIYDEWHLQVYTAGLHKIYIIQSRYYNMLLNKSFKCWILSKKKIRVEHEKNSVGQESGNK